MDVKEAGSAGGKRAWANLSPQERSRIMSERNRKRWKKAKKGAKARQRSRPKPNPVLEEDAVNLPENLPD